MSASSGPLDSVNDSDQVLCVCTGATLCVFAGVSFFFLCTLGSRYVCCAYIYSVCVFSP